MFSDRAIKETEMTIELSKITFDNDFFSIVLPDGNELVLNKVDEDFIPSSSGTNCVVRSINVAMVDEEGNFIDCPCTIGMSNDIMEIKTDYKQYEGEVLTPDNMMYCTIEVYE